MTTIRHRLMAVAALAAVAALSLGCESAPADPPPSETTTTTTAAAPAPTTTTTVAPEPIGPTWPAQAAGSTIVEGDSVTWQYLNGGGQADYPTAEFHAGPGDGLWNCYRSWNPDCTTSEAHVTDAVARGAADRVVIAHGANDSASSGAASDGLADGWSPDDTAAWDRIMFQTIPADSCVVLVQPYVEAPQPAANVEGAALAAAWMAEVPARRPNTVVVAWEPYYHSPGVAWYDGAHLNAVEGGRTILDTLAHRTDVEDLTPEARDARRAVIAEGLAQCAPQPALEPSPTTTTTAPEPPATTTTTTTMAPYAEAVAPLVVGDSITWQTVMSGAFPDRWRGVTMMGWRMGTPEVQAALAAAATDGTRKVVVALGTNDTALPGPYNPNADGWSDVDADLWLSTLNLLPADVQVTLVKPWLGDTASAAHRAEVDQARAYMDLIVGLRPNTTTVDWRTSVDANPEVLGPDGIHLRPQVEGNSYPVTDVAAAARVDIIAQGLA